MIDGGKVLKIFVIGGIGLPLGEKFMVADDHSCTVNEFTNFITDSLQLKRCRHIPTLPV